MRKHFKKDLIMTPEDEEQFIKSDRCHICDKGYEVNNFKVRDHCHVTGTYRGSAHNECNINFKLRMSIRIPVVFHNLRGYDSHFIIDEIGSLHVINMVR